MKIKICDRCKQGIPELGKPPVLMLEIQSEGADHTTLNWWLGKKTTVELCEKCFNEFWRFSKTAN